MTFETSGSHTTVLAKSWQRTFWATALLTIPMLGLITSTFWWHRGGGSAVLFGLFGFNLLSLLAYPLIYFAGLTLYVKRLRSLLENIPEKARALAPDALWLIIAVPVNFVGSFFVITGIARSLAADGRLDPATVRRWHYLGIAWCTFQVLSFVPVMSVSFIAVLLGYALWAAHWIYSVRVDEQLTPSREADTDE
ncbi:Uncharacterised protein [Mycobacteroides abscessus subsp. abscessus]|uniref:hypothetical protein n=1 Tax=Mycobacteroides abscessus TaxID=36809 RepID=UPI0009A55E02|nr:hypothetical protein [Mycobacteroides abscessus]SKS49731.1 Uncharacterised protein [Mycobacteroides abscessus subsp. abscessus]